MTIEAIDKEAALRRLGGAPASGVLAGDLRVVALDWREGGSTEHIVHASQLATFVEATKRLHFDPGVNPATGGETARVWRIRAAPLHAHGPYWWARVDLGEAANSVGAFTFSAGLSATVWRDETYEALA